MNYKMIAIDLDGTLLNDEKVISNENIKVLRYLNSIGVEIVIATGRRFWSAKQITEILDVALVILANNGNIVWNIREEKPLITKYIPKKDFDCLINEGKKRGLFPVTHVNHYDEGYDFMLELCINDKRYHSYFREREERYKIIDDLQNYKMNKAIVSCYMGNYEELRQFEKYMQDNYPGKYNSHIMKSSNLGIILEFMNPAGSKWMNLREYAIDKGISQEEIITIGDDNNDIEMIENAGLGIAMKNGTTEVRAVAKIITEKTNNESGVAHVLSGIFSINQLD